MQKKNVGLHVQKVHKQTVQVYARIIKLCDYQYEVEFKGSPLLKFLKPGGASDHGKRNKNSRAFQQNTVQEIQQPQQ